ncbi:lysozyme inhibitor LprI family protein [Klebsiella quasipneumoniae subsp. quasipneumoniae]|uniref:lysozyme inhibitor LprI family protein n=1 Tax=Klebsiella quasipneumoniae TaxID=1463165 RepID=UPI00292AD8B0|nr:lysozyme inhibitor LprI family protein [Klebsiella quasipneumoniae]MDV1506006.1 lysozyme inhibitor LprI family protein [Klebsiella quasipneumoniae subsp. quasipneumoniae]MDV1521083.1 lysozyme inhibitor LprI family protein [Klebsiella quasipneumoniae subsp. quasipneumoniae]MDV1558054.1 lysozyme inhibitor LprI family protein [Klebsiella quasipneumoniae subsp. quasipneumoniae]MDV1580549.1 lysozyme inhibitor LprI family protein [Klebsiella quasipneumoniae subsp. quasipneumoniae]MDW2626258.1 lys
MKPLKSFKIIMLLSITLPAAALATPSSFNGFHDIGSIDELMALPREELCSNGGPSRSEIDLILLDGPLALPMYQNDPNAARLLLKEQSQNIRAKIKQKCLAKDSVPLRKLTKAMLSNEEEMCKAGAPTKDELKVFIKESNEIDIDEQLRKMPYEGRLLMEEAAKLNGTTFREMFIDDVTNAAAKNWEKACSEKSYLKKSKKKGSDSKNDDTEPNFESEDKADFSKEYNVSDQKLNDAWQNLNKETRKSLLPAQRQWIKSKSACNGNWECLTNMTNERILELETENGK